METEKNFIVTEVIVNAPIEKVWKVWTTPVDIMQWNNCSAEWRTPLVEIDLNEGGNFLYRMELADGSQGFDHTGKYDKVITNELIEYTVSDGRKSIITFKTKENSTTVTETFEPEKQTPVDLQKEFCQKILDNFKSYTEAI